MQYLLLSPGIMSDFSLHLNSMQLLDKYQLNTNTYTRDCGGRTRNLPAGWVANNSIESPLCKGDFWLLSHAGLLGSKMIVPFLLLMLN